jgi:hypothetical protein
MKKTIEQKIYSWIAVILGFGFMAVFSIEGWFLFNFKSNVFLEMLKLSFLSEFLTLSQIQAVGVIWWVMWLWFSVLMFIIAGSYQNSSKHVALK